MFRTVRSRFWAMVFQLASLTLAACSDPTGPDVPERPLTFVQQSGAWRLFRILADGSALHAIPLPQDNSIYPAVSFDGRSVAYISEGAEGGVFVFSFATGISQRVYPDASVDRLAWSPDGRQLLIVTTLSDPAGSRGLRLLNLADGNVLDIAPGYGEPAWSPDGQTILAVVFGPGLRPPGIYALSPNGSNERLIIPSTTVGVRDPSWAPDGSRIAFARGIYGASFIFSARPDGSDVRQLTVAAPTGSTDLGPVWAPDGSQIAFQRFYFLCPSGCPARYDVFVMLPDGSRLHNVTQTAPWGGVRPSW